MKYKGTVLLLDNFRSLLKGYSIDIQDIVRSAILDDIDIIPYLEVCKNNPIRLDQIRLGIKEGLNPVLFTIKNGNSLYKIRQLGRNNHSLEVLSRQLSKGYLSDVHLDKLLSWLESGYDVSRLDISILPCTLFDVFEDGFKQGFNMVEFNNGKVYSPEYIKSCLKIKSNLKDISPFLIDTYKQPCMKLFVSFSKIQDKNKWELLLRNVNSSITEDKLELLVKCVKNNIDISKLSDSRWSASCINLVLQAYLKGVNYSELLILEPVEEILNSRLNELLLAKTKKVSGRLRK